MIIAGQLLPKRPERGVSITKYFPYQVSPSTLGVLQRHEIEHCGTCLREKKMPPLRILVVDDFEPFRRFVCPILEREAGLQIIGEASDGLKAVQKIDELQPDLILLDIGLPELNGMEVARRASELAP